MLFTSEVIENIYTPLQAVTVIELHGEITAFSEQELINAYLEVSEAGSQMIILSFKGLEYMNSSGIGLLIMLWVRANRSGQQLVITNLNEHYQRILELTHLNDAIRIYPSIEEALKNFNQGPIVSPHQKNSTFIR